MSTFAICTDALNATARPSASKLRRISQYVGTRNVLFDDVQFYGYYHALYTAGVPQLVLVAGESLPDDDIAAQVRHYATVLKDEPPAQWLILNEPNGIESPDPNIPTSSWILTPQVAADIWNASVPQIKAVIPDALCYVGGLCGEAPGDGNGWIDQFLPLLAVAPDGLDIHYPTSETTFQGWQGYGYQLSCTEWCYAGADVTRAEFDAWLRVMSLYTTFNAWFCASESQSPSMGIWTPAGRERKAFNDLQLGLRGLLGG